MLLWFRCWQHSGKIICGKIAVLPTLLPGYPTLIDRYTVRPGSGSVQFPLEWEDMNRLILVFHSNWSDNFFSWIANNMYFWKQPHFDVTRKTKKIANFSSPKAVSSDGNSCHYLFLVLFLVLLRIFSHDLFPLADVWDGDKVVNVYIVTFMWLLTLQGSFFYSFISHTSGHSDSFSLLENTGFSLLISKVIPVAYLQNHMETFCA